MKYAAKYTGVAYDAAVKDAIALIRRDSYYAMYAQGRYGTKITGRLDSGGLWGEFYLLGIKGYFESLRGVTEEQVLQLPAVGWVSCSGNRMLYAFDHQKKEVVLSVDSARHGIPSRALSSFVPDVVEMYESQQTDWAWHETMEDVRPRTPVPPAARRMVAGDSYKKLSAEFWPDEIQAAQEFIQAWRLTGDVIDKHPATSAVFKPTPTQVAPAMKSNTHEAQGARLLAAGAVAEVQIELPLPPLAEDIERVVALLDGQFARIDAINHGLSSAIVLTPLSWTILRHAALVYADVVRLPKAVVVSDGRGTSA